MNRISKENNKIGNMPKSNTKPIIDSKQHLNKTNKTQQKTILETIDKSLNHLNQISQANIQAQELFIQLLKEKKTMKFHQIKKIYKTLTQSKAKQILFERDKSNLKNTSCENHQGLVRLCWRLIEKLIRKIAFYIVNENKLSSISKNVLNLIHFNHHFVRRFKEQKNSSISNVIEMMDKLIQENTILQKKIYQILLNRGYVTSLDQFYKLNGYDAQHKDAYQATTKQQQQLTFQKDLKDHHKNRTNQNQQLVSPTTQKKRFGQKKNLKSDLKNTWKQSKSKIEKKNNQLFKEDQKSSTFSINKTNFEIRESFHKLICDFVNHETIIKSLNNKEGLIKENNKVDKIQLRKKQSKMNEEELIEKKIFENKMQTVINELKSNNLKVNSQLLSIIDQAAIEAISSKLNSGQRRQSERKNTLTKESERNKSSRRQSGFEHKILRASYLVNDRKLLSQNIFKSLFNKEQFIENYLHQQVNQESSQIKTHHIDRIQDTHQVQMQRLQHNQNCLQQHQRKSILQQHQTKTDFYNHENKSVILKEDKKEHKPSKFLDFYEGCWISAPNITNSNKKIELIKNNQVVKINKNNIQPIIRTSLEVYQNVKKQQDLCQQTSANTFCDTFKSEKASESVRSAENNHIRIYPIKQFYKDKSQKNNSLILGNQINKKHQNSTLFNDKATKLFRSIGNLLNIQFGEKYRNQLVLRNKKNDQVITKIRNQQIQRKSKNEKNQRMKTQKSQRQTQNTYIYIYGHSNNNIYEVFDRRNRRLLSPNY